MTSRTYVVNQLVHELDKNYIPCDLYPCPDRNGYQIITYDRTGNPLASTILIDGSYGSVANLFETAIYDEQGRIAQTTGWQTISEVVDTLRALL